MPNNKIIFRTGIGWSSGASDTIPLPKGKNISGIGFIYRAAALTGGSSGTYVPNSALAKIHLIVGGKTLVRWDLDADAAQVAYGIGAMRELAQALQGIANAAEQFPIPLPDALPIDEKIEVFYEWNTIAKIQTAGGNRTTNTSTMDLYYVLGDTIPGDEILPYVKGGKKNVGTSTSYEFTLPATEEGFLCSYLILVGEDNGTPANDAVEFLEIERGEEKIFKGYFTDIQQRYREDFSVAPTTGYAVYDMEGRAFGSDEISIKVTKPSGAGTDVDVHFVMVMEEPAEEDILALEEALA